MFVKKRITNSSSVKGALFYVHNLLWVCSRSREKKQKMEKWKEENIK